MAALKLAAAGLLLAPTAAAAADSVERWAAPIHEASLRFALPEAWIRRVIRAESCGKTLWRGRPIQSSAGAMGLMQLMPATWREIRAVHELGADPNDPRDNILAGTAYLRAMYDRFGYPGMFAAYNAGPGRYAEHLATDRRLPSETRAYVAKIVMGVGAPSRPSVSLRRAAPNSLFALHPGSAIQVRSVQGAASAPPSMFVALGGKLAGGDRLQ